MTRERWIDPAIWTDAKFKRMDHIGRLLWIGILTTADDEGRRTADIAELKASIFPDDPLPPDSIGTNLSYLSKKNMITVYEVEGSRYLQVNKWMKYQRLRYYKHSRIPPVSGKICQNLTEFAQALHYTTQHNTTLHNTTQHEAEIPTEAEGEAVLREMATPHTPAWVRAQWSKALGHFGFTESAIPLISRQDFHSDAAGHIQKLDREIEQAVAGYCGGDWPLFLREVARVLEFYRDGDLLDNQGRTLKIWNLRQIVNDLHELRRQMDAWEAENGAEWEAVKDYDKSGVEDRAGGGGAI